MISFNIPPLTRSEIKYNFQSIESHITCEDGEFPKKCTLWMKNRFSAKKVLPTTSCTSALEMAAILCDVQPCFDIRNRAIVVAYSLVTKTYLHLNFLEKCIEKRVQVKESKRLIEKVIK